MVSFWSNIERKSINVQFKIQITDVKYSRQSEYNEEFVPIDNFLHNIGPLVDNYLKIEGLCCCNVIAGFFIDADGKPWIDESYVDEFWCTMTWFSGLEYLLRQEIESYSIEKHDLEGLGPEDTHTPFPISNYYITDIAFNKQPDKNIKIFWESGAHPWEQSNMVLISNGTEVLISDIGLSIYRVSLRDLVEGVIREGSKLSIVTNELRDHLLKMKSINNDSEKNSQDIVRRIDVLLDQYPENAQEDVDSLRRVYEKWIKYK